MRPAGDVSKALLEAVKQLATAERGATLREVAHAAGVSVEVARNLIPKMKQAGRICIRGERRVQGRNRPVAEYAPPMAVDAAAGDTACGLALALRAWG